MTTTYHQQQETRSRIRRTIEELRKEGSTVPQLIEALRNELTLLHFEDDANADSLHGSGAGSSQTTAVNESQGLINHDTSN
jgi:hypothetical protein